MSTLFSPAHCASHPLRGFRSCSACRRSAMQRLEEERGALLRRIPYLTLQLIRPVGFTVQIVLKRLCENFVAAGRGVVAGEVPVSDGVVYDAIGDS